MRRLTALTAVAALAVALPAMAQPLFEIPGRITWRPLAEPPPDAFMIDPDGMHYVRSESDDSYVHCLPDGALDHPDRIRDFGQARRGFRSHFMLVRAADQRSVYVIEQRSLDEYSLRVLRLDCRNPDPERRGDVLAELRGEDNPFAALVRSERQRGAVSRQRTDGRLCIAGLGGMTCFDPAAPAPELVVDPAELLAAEPFDPAFAAAAGALERVPLVDFDQRVGDVVVGPDGRLLFTFYRLMHFAGAPAPDFGEEAAVTAQLVELTAEDGLVVRSPQWVPGHLTPLTRPELYWPEIDAWIGRPTQVWQYSDARPSNGGAVPSGGGWGGEGLMVVPADRSGFGYVPFTRALIRAHDCTACSSEIPQLGLQVDDAGQLVARYTPGSGRDVVEQAYAFEVDPDALDLDDDGLSRALERELGTDPTHPDSDGGGTPDRDEVMLWGTDPLDDSDDFAGIVDPMGFGISESGLVKLRLPAPPDGTRYGWGTMTGAGPLCLDSGECYGPDGRVVATLPPNAGVVAYNSLDGEHLFYWQGDDLRVRSIVSGADRAVARAGDLPDRDAGQPIIVVPVDDRRAWVADVQRIVWLEGAPGDPGAARITPLFDLDAARDAVGLSDRAEGAINSQIYRGLQIHDLDVLGYHHESDQLVFSVAGAYENWVLVVGRSTEARVVRHARELLGLRHDASRAPAVTPGQYPSAGPPYALRRIGTGGYLSLRGGFGPDLRRGPYPTRTGGFAGTVVWGGVGIRSVASGTFFPGLTAFVGYRPTVDAGDVLWFPSERDGDFVPRGTLYKSGAQGGFVRLMAEADPIFRRVTGADIDAAGRLCVVNHVPDEPWADAVLVLEPDGSGDRVPTSVRLIGAEPGARDCAWGADGGLNLLLDDPPRLAVMDPTTGEVLPQRDLDVPAGAEVLRLVPRPTGGFDILHTRSEWRGLSHGPSGRRLTLTNDNVLQVDGVTVAGPLQLVYDDRDRIGEVDAQIPLFADLIERPDGLIVIHPFRVELETFGTAWLTRHWVVDPETGAVAELGVGDHPVDGAATIRVPGGEAVDPWTGEPIGDGPAGSPGAAPPEAPTAPSGGVQVPQNTSTEGGCRAAPGADRAPWWLVCVLALGLRRRRRG